MRTAGGGEIRPNHANVTPSPVPSEAGFQRSTLPFPGEADRNGDAGAARASRSHAHACVTRIAAAIPRASLVHRPNNSHHRRCRPAQEKKAATLAAVRALRVSHPKITAPKAVCNMLCGLHPQPLGMATAFGCKEVREALEKLLEDAKSEAAAEREVAAESRPDRFYDAPRPEVRATRLRT